MYRLCPDVSTGFCGLHHVGPNQAGFTMSSREALQAMSAIAFLFASAASHSQVMCPDGSFVSRAPCTMCPDGTFVGGSASCQMAPNGRFVAQDPHQPRSVQMAPDGSFVSGGRGIVMCPDGSFVAGTRCVMAPNGRFVGN